VPDVVVAELRVPLPVEERLVPELPVEVRPVDVARELPLFVEPLPLEAPELAPLDFPEVLEPVLPTEAEPAEALPPVAELAAEVVAMELLVEEAPAEPEAEALWELADVELPVGPAAVVVVDVVDDDEAELLTAALALREPEAELEVPAVELAEADEAAVEELWEEEPVAVAVDDELPWVALEPQPVEPTTATMAAAKKYMPLFMIPPPNRLGSCRSVGSNSRICDRQPLPSKETSAAVTGSVQGRRSFVRRHLPSGHPG
jgi:hypothetical protein